MFPVPQIMQNIFLFYTFFKTVICYGGCCFNKKLELGWWEKILRSGNYTLTHLSFLIAQK